MEIVCALSGFIGLERPKKGLLALRESGFSSILLDLAKCCPSGELENFGKPEENNGKENKERIFVSRQPEKLSESAAEMIRQCREQQMRVSVACTPYLDLNTKRGDLTGLLSRLAKESVKVCGQVGCGRLIVRPVFAKPQQGKEWEVNRQYYLDLADTARKYNVMILLENQYRNLNGHFIRGICAEAEEAAMWIDRLNEEVGEERFGFCMDVGVCILCRQRMREFIMTLGNRIKAVILHDSDGSHAAAMLPFTCANYGRSQGWLDLIRGLREICFDGALVMDFANTMAAFPDLLRPQILPLAKSVADYFKWQIGMKAVLQKYDKRVLFGAGNMCRNYMKCYGEEFPPLFTCDNDRKRWGEQFEGLEIRPPEALREINPDCVVLICNVYYREIEEQLRRMGIGNPVEYFNDEYMPSYYLDKLEYWQSDGE